MIEEQGLQSFGTVRQLCQNSSIEDIKSVLDFLLWECEIEQGPSIDEARIWQQTLTARGGQFLKYTEQIQQWLTQEEARAKE